MPFAQREVVPTNVGRKVADYYNDILQQDEDQCVRPEENYER